MDEAQERLSVTTHTLGSLRYTATAGTLLLKEEVEKEGLFEGLKPKAEMFFVAYTLEGGTPSRPLVFAFNGGPGSSSVWLHLGLLGPRRVEMGDAGALRPWQLEENPESLLPHADLVFIDPVGTGYSRMLQGEKVKEYHGVQRDLESVAAFIYRYTSRYGRWGSPKFLLGESYGTTRAAGLARYLQERYGLYLEGIALISMVLNFATLSFDPGNDLPYPLYLPTYAATAWYHHRLSPRLNERPLEELLSEVETFALEAYAPALLWGDRLGKRRYAQILSELVRYTGLSRSYLEATHLRPEIFRFTKELLRREERTVGRLDSRFTGRDRDAAGERFEFDPSYAAIQGPYAAALHEQLRTLDYASDLSYEILTDRVQPWSYRESENRYLNVGEDLRQALNHHPTLRVLVACGLYDLATPHFAADYTLSHLELPPEARSRIQVHRYPAGHMMYLHAPSRRALAEALRVWLKES